MELNGFEIDIFNQHNIKQGASSWTCPKCSDLRKNNKQKCMSVFWDTGLGQCSHCGETIQLHTYKRKDMTKEYIRPVSRPYLNAYSDKLKQWWVSVRGLSLNCLEAFKIRETKEWMPQVEREQNCIAFDYFYNGNLINTKFRDGKKNFKLVKGAEKILYNIDSIISSKEALIVEGEFDVMAWWDAGYKHAVSVPNGFNLKGNVNLDFLDGYIDIFESKEVVYLGVDNDDAGRKGREELIRRFGSEKCKVIDYFDCKDANEYLIKHGKESLMSLISTAKEIPMEGVYTAKDLEKDIYYHYRNGQKRGTTTYYPEIDKFWTWKEQEVNLWTGYNNEGKSAMILQLSLLRALHEGVSVGVFSPENIPMVDFFNDLIETLIGKSVDPHYQFNYMSEEDLEYGLNIVKNYFFMIYPEKDFTLDSIFEKAKMLVRRHGIRTLIIDPYNTVEHLLEKGAREDLYISQFMRKLKEFATTYNCSVHLVAHQNTPKKNKDDEGRYFKPYGDNTKGGGTFTDKTDNSLFIWRPNRAIDYKDTSVIFGSQKIKKQKLVGVPGEIEMQFDRATNRFLINGKSPFEYFDKIRNTTPELQKPDQPKEYWPPRDDSKYLDYSIPTKEQEILSTNEEPF